TDLSVAVGLVRASLGDVAAAAEAAERAGRAARRLTADRPRALALALRCVVATLQGDLHGAVRAGREADAAARRSTNPTGGAPAHRGLGEALIAVGAIDEGRARIIGFCGGPKLAVVPSFARAKVFDALAEAELALEAIDEAQLWVNAAGDHAARVTLAGATAD